MIAPVAQQTALCLRRARSLKLFRVRSRRIDRSGCSIHSPARCGTSYIKIPASIFFLISTRNRLPNGFSEVPPQFGQRIFGAPFHSLPFVHVFDLIWKTEVVVVVRSFDSCYAGSKYSLQTARSESAAAGKYCGDSVPDDGLCFEPGGFRRRLLHGIATGCDQRRRVKRSSQVTISRTTDARRLTH